MTQVEVSSAGEARVRADKIRHGFPNVAAWCLTVAAAYAKRDWEALGYSSWQEYTDSEFADLRESIPEPLMKQVHAAMRAENMDVRAIAAFTGKGKSTVARHVNALSQDGTTHGRLAISGGRAYERSAPTSTDSDAAAEDPLPPEVAEQIDQRIAQKTQPKREPVMLTLRTNKGEEVPYPKPQSKATFNESTGEGISWAAWSWNPVTGCLHGCDYCYARAIAHRYPDAYPVGFTPLFHEERLDAPSNTTIPERHRDNPAYRRVFVCSMADLYGRWVPDEWIGKVHNSMLAAPDWQYILLTKFPSRYAGLDIPPRAWVGTSVDEQKRVRIAQDAMAKLDGGMVRWLSLEPLKEPLEFDDLSMFDWVVIGAQTETHQPAGTVPAFAPPFEWVARLVAQARESGCKVHLKPNLVNGRPGMALPDEYPTEDN